MAYEVTATRKRPKDLASLVGQEFVVATLRNSLAEGHIAHAYLFSGPRGVGKTSAARILAKALNAPDGPSADPGEYPGSAEIEKGGSIDVIEIDGASHTSVNDVRQIRDEVLFAPSSFRYKVYIIDEVHMLSNSAFNALLKTIEEPPPYVVFIFATTEVHKVPATIRSRCQQFVFRLVGLDQIRDLLQSACDESDIKGDQDALLWIAKEARGSVRDAYTLFDQVAAFSEGHISMEKIQDKLGLVGQDRLNALGELLVAGNTAEALAQVDEVLSSGVSVDKFAVDLVEYFRSLVLLANGIDRESILGRPPDSFSENVRSYYDTTKLTHAVELLLDLYRDLRYSVNERFELEVTVARLASLGDYVTGAEVRRRVAARRHELAAAAPGTVGRPATGSAGTSGDAGATPPGKDGSAAAPRGADAPTGAAAATEPGPAGDHTDDGSSPPSDGEAWQTKVARSVARESPALASVVGNHEAWRFVGDELVLTVDTDFAYQQAKSEIAAIKRGLAEALGEGKTPELRLEGPHNPGNATGGGAAAPQATAPPEAELARRVFRGEIVEQGGS